MRRPPKRLPGRGCPFDAWLKTAEWECEGEWERECECECVCVCVWSSSDGLSSVVVLVAAN